MNRFDCPICKIDLSNAMEVLGSPLEVFTIHMGFHLKGFDSSIFVYLRNHRDELPQELLDRCDKRLEGIRALCQAKSMLEMMIENGSL